MYRIPLQIESCSDEETTSTFRHRFVHSPPSRLEIQGKHKERFAVQFLEKDIVRVTCWADGKPRMDRTWIRCNENNDVPLQGLPRDDLSRFTCPPIQVSSASDSSSCSLHIQQEQIQIHVQLQPSIALSWEDNDKSLVFLKDRPIEAYVFEPDAAYHYLVRHTEFEHYYGFGETSGTLDKQGSRIRLDPKDALGYDAETSDPLYKHHPFYITWNTRLGIGVGILYDTMLPCVFDMGKEKQAIYGSYRYFSVQGRDIDYYVIYGPSMAQILEKLALLTGYPPRIPKWALYYLGSGMFYTEREDAQQQLKNFVSNCIRHDIVAGGFHFSSGYSTDEKNRRQMFHWNENKIPNVSQVIQYFHSHHMHCIVNVKPWLLCSNPHYTQAKELGLLVFQSANPTTNRQSQKEEETTSQVKEPCLFPLWSSEASISEYGSYLDFTNEATIEWWIEMLEKHYLSHGIDGIWNDNNEWDVCDWHSRLSLGYCFKQIGRPIQSLCMAKASREAMLRHNPHNRRPFLISRCTCLGMQRYVSQSWSGDNYTSWKTLQYNIPMSLGMSLSGFPFVGHDTGGFAGPPVDPELFIRWIQVNIFMPRFVIHSGWKSSRVNEPWMYPSLMERVTHALKFRQQLIPHLYNLHMFASETGQPVIRPLIYHFPLDEQCANESFCFLLGSWMLICPITSSSCATNEISVYLPKDEETDGGRPWYDYYHQRWCTAGQTIQVQVVEQGVPLFIRAGAMILLERGNPWDDYPLYRRLVCYPDPRRDDHWYREELYIWIEKDTNGEHSSSSGLKARLDCTKDEVRLFLSWWSNGDSRESSCDLSGWFLDIEFIECHPRRPTCSVVWSDELMMSWAHHFLVVHRSSDGE